MIRVTRMVSMLAFAAVVAVGADASAQGKKPAPAPASPPAQWKKKPGSKADPKMAEAKRLFDEGAKHYSEGNYEKAIESWEMSYELSHRELICESIANAYERLGQPEKAREYLVRWRAAAPPEEHETLDARLKNLDERIAREEKERKAQEEGDGQPVRAKGPPPPPAGVFLPGVVLAGVGAAAVAAGVTLDIIASGKRPDEGDACRPLGGNQICRASEQDRIESSNGLAVAGDVLWIAGGVMATVGVVLLVTQSGSAASKETAGAMRVVPIVTPRGAGVTIGRTF